MKSAYKMPIDLCHLSGVAEFDKTALKKAETVEKNVLPDKDAIEGERNAASAE